MTEDSGSYEAAHIEVLEGSRRSAGGRGCTSARPADAVSTRWCARPSARR
ncbi:hypothetical protein ACFQ60_07620 [Streptomyces zhihengii]